jgi:hypothetical protein
LTTSALSDVAGRRLIFCITSGRSGSKYLTDLFATACGVRSFHEAPPNMSGEPLRLVNTLPLEASREVRRVKADAIAAVLRGMAPEDVYAETNHMFIKTFFDVVLAEFHNVEVVILRRSLPHVLKSFIEMGYYSPLNPGALAWMSSPNAATAALRALGPDDALDPYDAAIGYLLDIEARAQRFMREYPWVRVHEERLEQLLERQQAAAFLERLDLVPTERTWSFVGQRVNERRHRKEHFNNPTTLDECRRRLNAYVARAEAAGIAIPTTAAFD